MIGLKENMDIDHTTKLLGSKVRVLDIKFFISVLGKGK